MNCFRVFVKSINNTILRILVDVLVTELFPCNWFLLLNKGLGELQSAHDADETMAPTPVKHPCLHHLLNCLLLCARWAFGGLFISIFGNLRGRLKPVKKL